MKTTIYSIWTKFIPGSLLSIFVILFLVSCASKTEFLTSSVVPAARGDVKVTQDKNKNYVIHVQIANLAEPDRLTPAKDIYVVWMVTDKDITKNVGQIKSSSGMLSKTLKASFETVSSFKPIKVFITAENDANIGYPGSQVVLTTNRF